MAAFITLGNLADQVAFERGEQGPFNKQFYLYHLIQCAKSLNFDIVGKIKVVELEMEDNLTVAFPADYVDYVRVGVRRGDKVETYTVNRKLALPSQHLITGPSMSPPDILGSYWPSYDVNGSNMGQNFGWGGGTNGVGYFREDRENEQFVFDTEINADYIYLEYIGTGISKTGATRMHPYSEDTLIAYVHWMIEKTKHGIGSRQERTARNEYYNHRRLLRSRLRGFTAKEYLEMARKYYGLAIKF